MNWSSTRTIVAAAVAGAALLAAACSDDEPAGGATVSEEQYEENVAGLCDQHGIALAEIQAEFENAARSDADRAAFFRSDYIPRVRSIVRALADEGFPAEHDAEYRESLSDALAAATLLEENTFEFIDGFRRGDLAEGENYLERIQIGLADAGIDCLG